jgi:type I restriction enzyme S subunit
MILKNNWKDWIMKEYKFEDIVLKKVGFLRGPFGGDLKKEIFVPKGEDTYKVYEQGVVLQRDSTIGKYYIGKDYFDNSMSRFEVKTNDFLVSCSGVNYGAIYQLKGQIEKGVINQALLRVRLNNEIIDDNYFLYLFRIYIVNMIIGKKGDSTIPNFPPLSVIKNLKFELPELPVQKKIGKILHSLDTKIELNNKINQKLEAMAKLLYDYWFVQFDFPNEQGKPYKSSGGKMVYNNFLKREIPEFWEVKNLGEVCNLYQPATISEKQMKIDGSYHVFGANGIVGKYDKFNHENSEIVVTCRGNSCGTILRTLPFSWITGNAMVVKSNTDYVQSEFIYQSLQWIGIDRAITGSAQPQITRTNLEPLKLLIPPKELLSKFNSIVEHNVTKRLLNFKENERLSELRDWLLPMLMNGQVTVGAEEKLNMAAEPSAKYNKI